MLFLASWILTYCVEMDVDVCDKFYQTSRLLVQLVGYFLFLALSGCRINLNHHASYVGQVYNHILYV